MKLNRLGNQKSIDAALLTVYLVVLEIIMLGLESIGQF